MLALYLDAVKIEKEYLCLFMGSKSFRLKTIGLADERTPTKISVSTVVIFLQRDKKYLTFELSTVFCARAMDVWHAYLQ